VCMKIAIWACVCVINGPTHASVQKKKKFVIGVYKTVWIL
jgi:hypothetical protein